MSNSDSESNYSYQSDDSEYNFIPGYAILEDADGENSNHESMKEASENDFSGVAHADEPLADEEWIRNYEAAQNDRREAEVKFRRRFDGSVAISEWCKCGNCCREFLCNAYKCLCCTEIDECGQALNSDLVLSDVANADLTCITDHPGFNPVCLQKWSLRMEADKLKTRSKTKYAQIDSEARFLRSVSYREFTRLVYGILGNKRIPLPSCAYTMIRKTFPIKKEERHTGFVDNE